MFNRVSNLNISGDRTLSTVASAESARSSCDNLPEMAYSECCLVMGQLFLHLMTVRWGTWACLQPLERSFQPIRSPQFSCGNDCGACDNGDLFFFTRGVCCLTEHLN